MINELIKIEFNILLVKKYLKYIVLNLDEFIEI